MSGLSVVAAGAVLGVRHALETDHLAGGECGRHEGRSGRRRPHGPPRGVVPRRGHGVAGSGALVVSLVSSAPSIQAALVFLGGFSCLSTLTMTLVSAL
jgi:hypothetical protein